MRNLSILVLFYLLTNTIMFLRNCYENKEETIDHYKEDKQKFIFIVTLIFFFLIPLLLYDYFSNKDN